MDFQRTFPGGRFNLSLHNSHFVWSFTLNVAMLITFCSFFLNVEKLLSLLAEWELNEAVVLVKLKLKLANQLFLFHVIQKLT